MRRDGAPAAAVSGCRAWILGSTPRGARLAAAVVVPSAPWFGTAATRWAQKPPEKSPGRLVGNDPGRPKATMIVSCECMM